MSQDEEFKKLRRQFKPAADRRWWPIVPALVAGLVAWPAVPLPPFPSRNPGPPPCQAGIVENSQCLGISTGSYAFTPQLKTVETKIEAENVRVAHSGRSYVTIAWLGPLSRSDSADLTSGRIPRELEGALTAQLRANNAPRVTGDVVGDSPLIRLVLANEGGSEFGWRYVVHRLEGMTGAPDRLVAVAGMGLSQRETLMAAHDLAAQGIPMVGDVITADGLDTGGEGPGGPLSGLTRVAPSNTEELNAADAYLRTTELRTAMLVTDDNPDDLYDSTLAQDFKDGSLSGYWTAGGRIIEPFTGPDVGSQFHIIANNLCGVNHQDMVFYAGREALLTKFIQYLRHRTCRDQPLTVVTGSDAAGLLLDPETLGVLHDSDGSAPISVLYTALAFPGQLDSSGNPARAQYQDFERSFLAEGFPSTDLIDGWAIMAHDAVLTASLAIRNAAVSSRGLPTKEGVRGQLYLFNSQTNSVPCAGGTLQLDSTTGQPVGRPLPVLELGPSTTPQLVELSST